MLHSGNKPCSTTPMDTGPCECELRDDFTDNLMFSSVLFCVHWISLSTWDLGPEEIRAISDFAL